MSYRERTIWPNVIRAAEAEPHPPEPLPGISGMHHPVHAMGIDKIRGRLILVTLDPDPRSAAMMQADIQAAVGKNVKVIVLRCVVTNAFTFIRSLGDHRFSTPRIYYQYFAQEATHTLRSPKAFNAALDLLHASFETTLGCCVAGFPSYAAQFAQQFSIIGKFLGSGVEDIADFNPINLDSVLGICGIPAYNFSQSEVETLIESRYAEDTRRILVAHGVYDYLFPTRDQVALGLVHKGIKNIYQIDGLIQQCESIGHPLGENRLIAHNITKTKAIIKEFASVGLLHKEVEFELSDKGLAVRARLERKPQEGIITKILNILRVNIDLARLFAGLTNTF